MSRTTDIALASLGAIAAAAMVASSGEPVVAALRGGGIESALLRLSWPNTILFNLSTGYLVTLLFWALVVRLPERRRRNVLRTNISRRYQAFKEEVIQSLLWASIGSHDSELPKQLSDHREFKAFFSQNGNEHWYAALNGIQGDEQRMHEISLAMDMFAREIAYVLDNVPIDDDVAHSLLKGLHESVYRLRESHADTYDQVKYVGNFLWGILARWSFVHGQRQDDAIQSVIDSI